MLRLILVRHAKSAWDDPGLADIDRPLAERGLEAAAWIGDTLARLKLVPEIILCSPARRTRETLELAMARLDADLRQGEVVWSDELYEQRDEDYIDVIARDGGDAGVLMLVGHNPATEETATLLAGKGDPQALARLMDRFPTGAIAVLDFDVAHWRAAERGTGRLVHFERPPKN
ncbi:MAG: phosphohistidine phosphatase [Devosia sp.]|uniref:SixA phosphatase family protein n=1 Tax=Devosia sp. TaxID=1871048 RepID=UPI00261DE52D|nr:histidine phosphatase family protein [Devosia sp.]MDB5539665.1 phosphohistidine phosphatase [Devosia sp.]